MTSKRKLKVAIIGSGFGLYGLLPAFQVTSQCQVVAICGKQTERLVDYCKTISGLKLYTNWEKMLEMEDIDALAIAVPPDVQYQIAIVAIKKGIHIFAEKPLTATRPQAVTLTRLAKTYGVTTAVDFIFPEIEEWKIVKNIIAKNLHGKLLHIQATWDFHSYDLKNNLATWKTDEKMGGGALAFFGSHLLHNIRFFVGDYTMTSGHIIYSKESKNGGDVGFDSLFSTAVGVTGAMHLRCNAKGIHTHSYTFLFEKASLTLNSDEGVTGAFAVTLYTPMSQKKLNVEKKSLAVKNQDERVHEVQQLTGRFIKACQAKLPMTPSFEDGLFVQNKIHELRLKSKGYKTDH